MENKQNKKIALLIDAENISYNYLPIVFDELSKYGIITYKRVYGDWTTVSMTKWKHSMTEYALSPIQQFCNTQNKNSSDSALIIDAMDILYSRNIDSFCIVSSDSDFTRLITRIREDGLFVIGMGEKKSPKALVRVCDNFLYLDVLKNARRESTKKEEKTLAKENKSPSSKTQPSVNAQPSTNSKKSSRQDNNKLPLERDKLLATMKIIDELSQEDGYANFADVINRLSKLYSDMDSANYGYAKTSDLFASNDAFIMKKVNVNGANVLHIRVNE